MIINYSNPYNTQKNIGKALNEFCENCLDDSWIVLQDGDIMYLTPNWGKQIEEVIKKHGEEYQLFGCLTNRLGRHIQIADKNLYKEYDIRKHYSKAVELEKKHYAEVKDVTREGYIAGMLMIFNKRTWQENKFIENANNFDDLFSRSIKAKGGKLGVIQGLYVFHLYRIWALNPKFDKKHLE